MNVKTIEVLLYAFSLIVFLAMPLTELLAISTTNFSKKFILLFQSYPHALLMCRQPFSMGNHRTLFTYLLYPLLGHGDNR